MAIDVQSTVSMWVCLMLALVLIVTRLALRRWRKQGFTHGDGWCMCSAALIVARLVANHLLISYGSTRTLAQPRRIELNSPAFALEASKIVLGSKIVLLTRSLLVSLLWSLKMAVLDLISRLIINMPYERKLLYSLWVVLFATFATSIITTFTGCQPIARYWQIYPDPGECVVGNLWLLTYEVCNMSTDALLMAVAFYLVLSVNMPRIQRFRILSLFGIGLFLIAISVIRILQGRNARTQRSHTLWASLEVLLAVVVAVTPTIYTLIRNSNARRQSAMSTAPIRVFSNSIAERNEDDTHVWTEVHSSNYKVDVSSIYNKG
ncbi:hypothetical protein FB567DRAFT_457363 [Paraphoma chrysanthemicola]|uniref:Rhodopsin domain-containing protein n=1 Tax=Paraphoma chrysanthemicola TaxID=798071 RepID=A0A8K0QTE1_9PLEO|nr:hypothetical protein FB567DRAFT_457363 [Paraphoma chrysanthemicola]